MLSRFTLILALFAVAVGVARAGTPFTPDAFAAAQATGKPVLVEVHADWCPVCTRQKPIVSELLSQPALKGYEVLTVDFDKQKEALKLLNVQRQSTLIVFKGTKELGRSTGDTSRDGLSALLNKAL